jgi:hypothetical protein
VLSALKSTSGYVPQKTKEPESSLSHACSRITPARAHDAQAMRIIEGDVPLDELKRRFQQADMDDSGFLSECRGAGRRGANRARCLRADDSLLADG